MRRLRPILVTLVLAAGGLTAAGCGAASPTSYDLTKADAATRQAGTARVGMTIGVSAGGQDVTAAGAGVTDLRTHRARLSLDMSSLAETVGADPSDFQIDEVVDGLVVYMHFPYLVQQLGGSEDWIKLDLGKAGQSAGVDFGSLLQGGGGIDPTQFLTYLKATSGKVVKRGTDTVRGAHTTHYRATVDYEKLPATLPASQRAAARRSVQGIVRLTGGHEVPIDVWLDDADRLRRLTVDQTLKPSDGPQAGQSQHMEMTMELYGFGAPVSITTPPAADTKDITALAQQGLGQTTP